MFSGSPQSHPSTLWGGGSTHVRMPGGRDLFLADANTLLNFKEWFVNNDGLPLAKNRQFLLTNLESKCPKFFFHIF